MRIMLSSSVRGGGGIGTVTLTLTRGLAARGHEVVVLRHPHAEALWAGEPVLAAESLPRGMDLHPRSLWRAARALRRWRPDVLLALTKKDVRLSAPAARALGVPVVVRHANDQGLPRGPYGRLLYGAVPAVHVTNAAATRETILDSAPWLPPERVRVIYNGVDLARFDGVAPADLGLPPGAVAIGYVGSFEPRKGLPDLATAWPAVREAVPAAHLVLVGRGTHDELLRERLGRDPRVHFAGYRADAPAVMRALDLLVLPSYVEGAPNVVLEAMAAGRATVATAVSGTPELVEDSVTGRLVPPADPQTLGRVLVEVVRDRATLAAMGRAGRERVERDFTIAGMLDRYEGLLHETAGGVSPTGARGR